MLDAQLIKPFGNGCRSFRSVGAGSNGGDLTLEALAGIDRT